jgi:hypothetical protein
MSLGKPPGPVVVIKRWYVNVGGRTPTKEGVTVVPCWSLNGDPTFPVSDEGTETGELFPAELGLWFIFQGPENKTW